MHGTRQYKYTRRPASNAGGLTCALSGRRLTCGPCPTCRPGIRPANRAATRAAKRAAQCPTPPPTNRREFGPFLGLVGPLFDTAAQHRPTGRPCGPFVGLTCGRAESSRRALSRGPLVAAVTCGPCRPTWTGRATWTGRLTSNDRTRPNAYAQGRTIGKLWPNDSEKSPERFRSNDSVNVPERLFTSNRTNMFQVLFIILCLLVPAFNDWTEKCRNND